MKNKHYLTWIGLFLALLLFTGGCSQEVDPYVSSLAGEALVRSVEIIQDSLLAEAGPSQAAPSPNSGAKPSQAASSPDSGSVSSSLRVHFIDVGQGDSILIQNGEHAMLVDAGENDRSDTVVSYLQSQQIRTLDYVIGTHPHSDHIGGLDTVIRAMDVKRVIMPPIEHTTATFEDVLDAIADKGLKITRPVTGDCYPLGEASFTILAPAGEYKKDLNNWSVGIRLAFGDNSFVMCGDAETDAEADILKTGLELNADVLKVGHHGSHTSTSPAFLKAVSPDYAVIQCGEGNSYGHPHKETMNLLQKEGIQILRTDELGTIIGESDGSQIRWSHLTPSGKEEGLSLSQN